MALCVRVCVGECSTDDAIQCVDYYQMNPMQAMIGGRQVNHTFVWTFYPSIHIPIFQIQVQFSGKQEVTGTRVWTIEGGENQCIGVPQPT